MTQLHLSYACDEDVALLASADIGALFPADQLIIAGSDGVIDPSDRWTLQSASVDFLAAGLHPGHIVQLLAPIEQFRPPGAIFGVSEVSATAVVLRRIGMEPGTGAPAAPTEGLTGISFRSATLEPQLIQASRTLDRLLGLDPGTPGRRPEDLESGMVLRDAVVRLALARQYLAISQAGDNSYLARAGAFRAEFDEIIARSAFRADPGSLPSSARFATRMIR